MKNFIIIYDFDGTLTKPPLPKYLFIENLGYENGTQGGKFLNEMKEIQSQTGKETMHAYIDHMMQIIKDNNLQPTLEMLYKGQESLQWNEGVNTFFQTITNVAKRCNLKLLNYIITGGFAEYVANLEVAKNFSKIYGAEFEVDKEGNIGSVKKIMFNAMKIDSIKDILKNNGKDNSDCENVIYIGDGLTDKEAMDYVFNRGGKTIFVHHGNLDIFNAVNENNIVNYCFEADYTENGNIVKTITKIMEQVK